MTLSTDSIFVEAGVHRVAAAFVKRFDGPVDDLIRPLDHTLADTQIGLGYGVTTLPHLQTFTIVGPFGATGVAETPKATSCPAPKACESSPEGPYSGLLMAPIWFHALDKSKKGGLNKRQSCRNRKIC